MLRIILICVGILALGAGIFVVTQIGPRNVIGMLMYDRRREGDLHPGDRAPELALVALDGGSRVPLVSARSGRPLVLIFGSFT